MQKPYLKIAIETIKVANNDKESTVKTFHSTKQIQSHSYDLSNIITWMVKYKNHNHDHGPTPISLHVTANHIGFTEMLSRKQL